MDDPLGIFGTAFAVAMIYFILRSMSKVMSSGKGLEQPESSSVDIKQDFFDKLFVGKEFVNVDTKSLEQFIVNERLNHYDLHKLAQLNGIKLEIREGWTDLVVELIRELDERGWNKEVGSIKEKYGELRFYAGRDWHDIIEVYTRKSKTICEVCGEAGKLFENKGGWLATRCLAHQGGYQYEIDTEED